MTVNDVRGAVYDALKVYKMMQIFDAWERHQNEWKLIYSIYGLTGPKGFLIHARLVFLFDETKKNLKENVYLTLADLDCDYIPVPIGSDLKISLKNNIDVLCEVKGQIKDLSDFAIGGTDKFNEYLNKSNIDQSILDLKYNPQEDKCTCFDQIFDFTLSDRTEQKYFQIKRNAKNKMWNININGISFDVSILDDAYKQIIDTLYK